MNIQYSKLLLAVLVILSFCAVGVGIAFRSFLFSLAALIIGFGIMAYGIFIKQKVSQ